MISRKSESTIYPTTSYNFNEVLVPKNIVETERKFEDITVTIYTYDESVYSLSEWQSLKDEELRVSQEALNFLIMGGI